MIRVDVRYLFQLAGGPKGLIELMAKHYPRVSVAYPTVQMWSQRETVPARWLAIVLYVMIREGHSLLPLFTDDDELTEHDPRSGG